MKTIILFIALLVANFAHGQHLVLNCPCEEGLTYREQLHKNAILEFNFLDGYLAIRRMSGRDFYWFDGEFEKEDEGIHTLSVRRNKQIYHVILFNLTHKIVYIYHPDGELEVFRCTRI